jgi:hypothetical protein
MAIPALINGVLPPGTYPATINEIWATFDQARSMTRPALNLVLQHAVALIWAKDPTALIYVDGSYITSKVDPEDVDLAVRSDIWDDTLFAVAFTAAYPGEERLLDFFFNDKQSKQHMEDLFREILGSTVRKGIIQLLP